MPEAARIARPPRTRRPKVAAPRVGYTDARALLVIDQSRLQGAAWAEYHTAQKRHEKAARDLHRHEEIDTPAFQQWLHREFPLPLTTLRNLQDEVSTKAQRIQYIRAIAAYTGRSAKKLWQEQKEDEANPLPFDDDFDDPRKSENHRSDQGPETDDDFFADDDEPSRRQSRRNSHRTFEAPSRAPAPSRSLEAREIFRRLVQRLHPDRGGEWTLARKRLWHEVQQAWALGDADWLSRLEVEWETAHEVLSPTSPLSRLRRAIDELHAARRDTESKLRTYRRTPSWRFTLTEKKREILRGRTERKLREDVLFLQRQLAYLDATIQAWEEPSLGRTRPRHTHPQW